jgi:hypothetical protein
MDQNRKELVEALSKIAYDILDNIVSPVCSIPRGTIWADLWLADLECYCMEDDQEREKILVGIQERYSLNEQDMNNIDSYTPLMQIALFIYLLGKEVPNANAQKPE